MTTTTTTTTTTKATKIEKKATRAGILLDLARFYHALSSPNGGEILINSHIPMKVNPVRRKESASVTASSKKETRSLRCSEETVVFLGLKNSPEELRWQLAEWCLASDYCRFDDAGKEWTILLDEFLQVVSPFRPIGDDRFQSILQHLEKLEDIFDKFDHTHVGVEGKLFAVIHPVTTESRYCRGNWFSVEKDDKKEEQLTQQFRQLFGSRIMAIHREGEGEGEGGGASIKKILMSKDLLHLVVDAITGSGGMQLQELFDQVLAAGKKSLKAACTGPTLLKKLLLRNDPTQESGSKENAFSMNTSNIDSDVGGGTEEAAAYSPSTTRRDSASASSGGGGGGFFIGSIAEDSPMRMALPQEVLLSRRELSSEEVASLDLLKDMVVFFRANGFLDDICEYTVGGVVNVLVRCVCNVEIDTPNNH